MKNFVQTDDNITVAAPYALNSGDGCLVGHLFGFAIAGAASGANVVLVTEGVFDGTKTAGEAWAVGDIIYWHNGTAKALTTTSSGNVRVGVAVLAALSADVVGRVRLDGVAS